MAGRDDPDDFLAGINGPQPDMDAIAAIGRQVHAHDVGLNRQLAVTPVNQGGQANSRRPAQVANRVQRGADGAAGEQNVIHQNNVNLLHVSQAAIGDMNTQVATIAINHQNGWGPTSSSSPAKTCYLPAGSLNWIKQANLDSTIVEQAAVNRSEFGVPGASRGASGTPRVRTPTR